MILFMLLFPYKSAIATVTLCFLMGFASIPSIVIAVDLGAEISYPFNESFSTGIIMIFGQFFSVVFIIFASSILNKGSDIFEVELVYIILALASVAALWLCKPLKQELKRTAFEQEAKQK